jgi:DNA-binding transcriptional ArsR family regulator
MTAGELAEHFDVSKPTLSGHFTKLREADLILAIRDGTSIIYSLNLSVIEDALLGLVSRLRTEDGEGRAAQRAAKETRDD